MQIKRKVPRKPTPRVSKPKINTRKSTPRPRKPTNTAIPRSLIRAVCAYNDPFCEAARGAKLHDAGNIKSLPITVRKSLVLDCGIVGPFVHGAHLFQPAFNSLGFDSTTSAYPNYDFTSIKPASITFAPKAYRIITCGIIIRNTNAPLTTSGMVRIRTFNPITGTGFGTVDGTTSNYAQKLDIPLRDVHELAVLCTKTDPMMADRFHLVSSTYPGAIFTPDNWVSPGFSTIMISLDGAPTGATLELEFFYNYEVTFDDNDSLATLATQSPPANALIKQASAAVSSTTKTIFQKGMAEVEDFVAKNAVRALISAGSTAIGALFGGPAGARAGFATGNAGMNMIQNVD